MRRVGVLVLAFVGVSGLAEAADPLDKPFGATPAELRAAADAALTSAAPEANVVRLRYDQRYEIDAQRRVTMRTRIVYFVRTPKGDVWQRGDESWDPSYQGPLVVRARAIDPSGKELALDPAKQVRGAAELHYEFPGGVGSVVEEEMTLPETAVPYAAGHRDEQTFPSTRHVTFTLVAPAALHVLAPFVRGPVKPVTTHAIAKDGRETWTYDFGAVGPPPDLAGVPDDVTLEPTIAFTTGTTWAAVATAHRAAEDRAIAAAPLALPATLAHTPAAVLAWARAAIHEGRVPRLPPRTAAQIVASGTGSDADLSLVALAALRQLGIPADIVVATWRDHSANLDPALPGENRDDELLVRARVNGSDVWLAPGAAHARAGVLPFGLYGRHALAIVAGTTALAQTPPLRAIDHTVVNVQTITPSEDGGAGVVIRRYGTGAVDRGTRLWLADAGDTDAYFADRAKWWRGKPVSHTHDIPDALESPASTTETIAEAARVSGSGIAITIPVDGYEVVEDRVPDVLTDPETDDEPPRTIDYVWSTPTIAEREIRVAIPPGFAAPALAPDDTRQLGPASVTTHRALDHQTLVIRQRFDPGKLRMTAAEYTAMHRAIIALRDAAVPRIELEEVAYTLEHAGKTREALVEEQRMAALHPKEAQHHDRLAEIYLAVGMGLAARREARAAIALEPKSADAADTLAYTLQHDSLGRAAVGDWDRARAIAAARKAVALAPTWPGGAARLAELLELDARGLEIHGPQPEAVAARRAASALDPDDAELSKALLATLVRANDPTLEAAARAQPVSKARDATIVLAVARARGAVAAFAETQDLRSGDERTEILVLAIRGLLVEREYDLVRRLATYIPAVASSVDNLDHIVRRANLPASDPRTALAAMLAAAFDPVHQPAAPVFDPAFEDSQRAGFLSMAGKRVSQEALPWTLDSMLVADTLKVDGAARGPWRVAATNAVGKMVVYIGLDHGVAKVIADAADPGFARAYLAAHRPGDAESRTLLAWLVVDAHGNPLVSLWKGAWPTDKADQAVAAAMFGADPARDIPILQTCKTTLGTAGARLACDTFLAALLERERRWPEADAFTAAWTGRPDPANAGRTLRVEALTAERKFDDAQRLVTDGLVATPDHHPLLLASVQLALARGQLGEAIHRSEFARKPTATAHDANNLAWLLAFEGRDLDDAKAVVDSAISKNYAPAILNTLAVIEAERGELSAAYRHLVDGINRTATAIPTDSDRYVLGRIAESLGLRDDARALYKQIAKPKTPLVVAGDPSAYDFAQKRLARL